MFKEAIQHAADAIMRGHANVWNREIKLKLTHRYLGVFMDFLRSSSGVLIDYQLIDGVKMPVLYAGTGTTYGIAYETGDAADWSRVKEDMGYKKAYEDTMAKMSGGKKGWRNNSWTGNRKHRPFLSDTITDGDLSSSAFFEAKRRWSGTNPKKENKRLSWNGRTFTEKRVG